MNTKKERTFFPENLKTFRCLNRMSIPQFAKLLKLDSKRLKEVENGRLLPKENEIDAVLNEFTGMTRERILHHRFELKLSEFSISELTKTKPDRVLMAHHNKGVRVVKKGVNTTPKEQEIKGEEEQPKRPQIKDFFPENATIYNAQKEYEASPILFEYIQALDNYIDSIEAPPKEETQEEVRAIEFAEWILLNIDSVDGDFYYKEDMDGNCRMNSKELYKEFLNFSITKNTP